MGFDLTQVLSDDRHYSPFVCSVCENLVSLDAVVTNRCSHPFCRQCLETWTADCIAEQNHCSCPTCKIDITTGPSKESIVIGFNSVAAQPLQQSQPLAYQVLKLVQVACIDRTRKVQCEWIGDYGSFLEHAATHGAACASHAFIWSSKRDRKSKTTTDSPTTPKKFQHEEAALVTPEATPGPGTLSAKIRPSMEGMKSLSSPSLISLDVGDASAQQTDQDSHETFAASQTQFMHKSLSLKDLSACDEDEEEVSIAELQQSMSSFGSKKNGKKNDSIASPPANKKAVPQRDSAPNHVQRTMSATNGSSTKGVDERVKAAPKVDRKKRRKSTQNDHDSDLEISYSHAMDWNMSINSIGDWDNSVRKPDPMETLNEDEENEDDFELEMEPEASDGDGSFAPAGEHEKQRTFERAEKLKKQANAKFNKGDFTAARVLYTDGINAMANVSADTDEDCELLSNMYSNRAVTFFREKRFEECIHDCDKAIGFDPTYDKSWIRKWRALMALGDFDNAYDCLEASSKAIPDSKRIKEEMDKCRGEKTLLTEARKLMEAGDYKKAREILKPHSRSSDNIGLLFVAARVDAGLGLTESALEKVNKALRFNPTHTEGLEIRGHTLFLTGETEKGAHLLQEAYDRNKNNKSVREELMRCQKTHSALTKGRSAVKRGRYVEAVEHFTNAIKESGELPFRAPLFGIIRTERAEASLLSKKYVDALKDCQEVLSAQRDNASAWSVRAEILISLGKAEDAKNELQKIRNSWGADNPTIDEAYRRADFELRVIKADEDLTSFLADLESGKAASSIMEESNSDMEQQPSRRRLKDEAEDGQQGSPRAVDENVARDRRDRRMSLDSNKNRWPSQGRDKSKERKARSKSRDPRKDNDRERSKSKGRDMANGVEERERKLERKGVSEKNLMGRKAHRNSANKRA